ncbi:putative HTH-type transcriptional regulator [Cotonvirus japonicus]|uniref:HTH-type transcriptional regulator n=1 Tax=Cotonvirus japonicus TaxID=2811091 RepID=A0ABM7NTD9_9VIRU|nr:putative HTH-type transcriptional regulator [Cotonvirus japonicus]BCS83361.1 putative HTH-type transcriptional regulator [Cotonvirus japonicus]
MNNLEQEIFDTDFVVELKPKHFVSPYSRDPNNVRLADFTDARIYDHQLREKTSLGSGWQIQRSTARKRYSKWLRTVRRKQGWENFRRAPIEVVQHVEDEYGNVYVIRKKINFNKRLPTETVLRKNAGKNRYTGNVQSKDKGVSVDDQDFRPRMFTPKMGREISALRNKLGLNQAELGTKLNIDANTVKSIETGNLVSFNSEDPLVRNMARILGVPSIRYQD